MPQWMRVDHSLNLVPKILLIAPTARSQGKKLGFCDTLSRLKIFLQTMAVIRLLPGPRHLCRTLHAAKRDSYL